MFPSPLPSSLPGPGGIACRFTPESVSFHPWGTTNTAANEPITPETRFPIASVTKPFTAHLLLDLLREDKLPLHTPIRTLLPDFALSDPLATREMTLEDALCHHSGLPPHTWAWVYSDVTRTEFIRNRLPHLESIGPHREQHRYSNILYAVLGEVIETLTGTHWEQTLHDLILYPLGLTQTEVLTETWAEVSSGLARPHNEDGEPLPAFHAKAGHLIAPASELISTAADLARWGQHLLRHPPPDDRWTPRNSVPDMENTGYGLGWRISEFKGTRRIWHSGQCSGYSALFVLYPDEKRGGVYLCNRSGAVPALHALDQNLPITPLTQQPTPPLPTLTPAKNPGLAEGTFFNPGYGILKIHNRNGIPHLIYQTAEPAPLLRHPDGTLIFQPPGYTAQIPLTFEKNTLHLQFEPRLAPIRFEPFQQKI
jgi:CubicO group peptidase (beta-lactamase class C family)